MIRNSKNIFAIDPGTKQSAFVLFSPTDKKILSFGKLDNEVVLARVLAYAPWDFDLVIEMIKSYGNVAGDSILMTCVWIGRFMQAWGRPCELIPRKTIVTNICMNPRAGDKEVRRALIDRFGGDECVGTKKRPGVLYGVNNDVWSALALAVVAHDIKEIELSKLLS